MAQHVGQEPLAFQLVDDVVCLCIPHNVRTLEVVKNLSSFDKAAEDFLSTHAHYNPEIDLSIWRAHIEQLRRQIFWYQGNFLNRTLEKFEVTLSGGEVYIPKNQETFPQFFKQTICKGNDMQLFRGAAGYIQTHLHLYDEGTNWADTEAELFVKTHQYLSKSAKDEHQRRYAIQQLSRLAKVHPFPGEFTEQISELERKIDEEKKK